MKMFVNGERRTAKTQIEIRHPYGPHIILNKRG